MKKYSTYMIQIKDKVLAFTIAAILSILAVIVFMLMQLSTTIQQLSLQISNVNETSKQPMEVQFDITEPEKYKEVDPPAPSVSIKTKKYFSETYNVSFDYPEEWTVYEDTQILDVKPPQPILSNYFTLEILDGEYSPNRTLADYISAKDLKAASFRINGAEVYTKTTTGAAGTVHYFLFTHNDKVYQLYMFDSWYQMPEVQAMIKSIELL